MYLGLPAPVEHPPASLVNDLVFLKQRQVYLRRYQTLFTVKTFRAEKGKPLVRVGRKATDPLDEAERGAARISGRAFSAIP